VGRRNAKRASGSRSGFPRDVKEMVCQAQHGICKCCNKPLVEFHHIIPNTKTNRKLFPHFIDSPFNCAGLCRKDHECANSLFREWLTLDIAIMYEGYLKEMKHVDTYSKYMASDTCTF